VGGLTSVIGLPAIQRGDGSSDQEPFFSFPRRGSRVTLSRYLRFFSGPFYFVFFRPSLSSKACAITGLAGVSPHRYFPSTLNPSLRATLIFPTWILFAPFTSDSPPNSFGAPPFAAYIWPFTEIVFPDLFFPIIRTLRRHQSLSSSQTFSLPHFSAEFPGDAHTPSQRRDIPTTPNSNLPN